MDRSLSGESGRNRLMVPAMRWLSCLCLVSMLFPTVPARTWQTECLEYRAWDLVMGVAVSQQNDLLAVSAGNNVYLYEMKPLVDEQEIQKYPAGSFSYSIKFNPEGTLLAAGSRDGFVRVWNVAGGDRLPVFSINAHRNGVNSIAFSHDGRMLASGGNDAVIRIWDIETEQLLIEMIGGTYAVPAIEFSPDNQHVAIANGEVIRIRDVSTGQIWGTIRSPGWLYNLAYNSDGSLLAASDIEQQIHIWDPREAYRSGVETYPEPQTLALQDSNASGFRTLVWDIVFKPDEQMVVAAYGDGYIRSWSLETGKIVEIWDHHSAGVTSLDISPDGITQVSGSLDARACVFTVTN